MSKPGTSALLHYLSGGSQHNASEYYGRVVKAAELKNDRLNLEFADGTSVSLWDNGQSCCESRYMTTDDKVADLIGGTLRLIEAKEHKDAEGEYGDSHEQVFVEVATDKASITLVNHNEHNGYYGGFGLTLTEGDA